MIFYNKLENIDVRLSEAEFGVFGMHLSALQYIGLFFSFLVWERVVFHLLFD